MLKILKNIIFFCSALFFLQIVHAQPVTKILEDSFESSSNLWWVYDAGKTYNKFCIVDSIYSIDGNSLQTCSLNSNTQALEIGYTYANNVRSEIAYRSVNAINYYNLTISFEWKCNGEKDRDYGSFYYSKDGNDWILLKNMQSGKGNDVLTEMYKMPKCVENDDFFIGFSFTSDNSFNFQPGLIVDNLILYGSLCTATSKPPKPTPNSSTITKCYNDEKNVILTANSSTNNLRWYNSINCDEFIHEGKELSVLPIQNKTFYITTFNPSNGCESSSKSMINLNILSLPKLIDTTIVNATYGKDGSIDATVSGTPPLTYNWKLESDPDFKSTVLDLISLDMGNYQLTVTDGNKCQDSFKIVLLSGAELDIPQGISPNADGFNDTWIITGIQQWQDFSVELRNMRGELVYRQDATDNPAYVPMNGMDANGVKLPAGDYTYVIRSKSRKRKYSGILSIKYD